VVINRAIDEVNVEVEQVVSVFVVRAAIADVLDAGWQCEHGCDLRHPWMFPTEMFAGDDVPTDDDLLQRECFMDAVCARITALQAPPHNLDAGLRALVEKAKEKTK
jgi:hypothetical protein